MGQELQRCEKTSEGKKPGRKFRGGITLPLGNTVVLPRPVTPDPDGDSLLPARLSEMTKVRKDDEEVEVSARDLTPLSMLGQGQYGTVEKVRHTPSGLIFAAKKIRFMLDSEERKRTLRETDVAMRSTPVPFTVIFYGALFYEGDAIILMEVMHINLRELYTRVYAVEEIIPEPVLQVIIYSLLQALDFLYKQLRMMHRDIKPTNVLANRSGQIKLCDFGICGELIDSIAHTSQIGSRPYLAPERIKTDEAQRGYTVRSDVWSLGITMLEMAIGKFPFKTWQNIFDQLNDVVYSEPPSLPPDSPYSSDLREFLEACLQKDAQQRLRYEQLLELPLLKRNDIDMDIADYVCRFIRSDEG